MPTKEQITYCPQSQEEWRQWLHEHHRTAQSVWLIYHRVTSGIPTLSWSEAVDEALCFGWIDSTRKSLNAHQFMQLFTQRKPKSTWSKVNKAKVQALIEAGRMTEAGLTSIATAKANGSWSLLDEVEALTIPKDLKQALSAQPKAHAFFQNLNKTNKKMILRWLASARQISTREKRIHAVLARALEQKMPKSF